MNRVKAIIGFALLVLSILVLWYAQSILMPFILGFMIAYFMRPIFNKLVDFKLSKNQAATLCILFVITIVSLFFATLVPILNEQLEMLIRVVGDNRRVTDKMFLPIYNKLKDINQNSAEHFQTLINHIATSIFTMFSSNLKYVLSSGAVAAHFISLVLVTPFALFYFIRDWDLMSTTVSQSIPSHYRKKFDKLMGQLDNSLSGYIRGQILVCTILSSFYTVSLLIAGLNYATAIGFLSGFLIFIPYLGALISAMLTLLVATLQFGDLKMIGIVFFIFLFGQFIEANFLVPRIIGDRLKIHPLWLIFGVLAGGAIFGFIGILVAVPLTAAIRVVIKFTIKEFNLCR